jgi:hypothetical protein
MVRTLGDETLAKFGTDTPVEERVRESAAPTADEVRAVVEGPRRPIRWMRWLAAFALIAAGAAIVASVALNDETQTAQYQIPTSADATQGALTISMYLPETSGSVYNYSPAVMVYDVAPDAGGPTISMYLPETSGSVYNYNPLLNQGPNVDLGS